VIYLVIVKLKFDVFSIQKGKNTFFLEQANFSYYDDLFMKIRFEITHKKATK